MLWKSYKCKECGETQENVSSKIEDTERECPSCGGTAKVTLTPKATKFKGGGWMTPKPIETFPGEPEDVRKWGAESHGVGGSLSAGIENQDKDW